MSERGWTLVEMLVVVAIIVVLAAASIPYLEAYSEESHLLGAGRQFKGEFLRGRSIATRLNVYTAIRFEAQADGTYFSLYADGNHNGVRSADIRRGIDRRVSGPFQLTGGAPGVRVGINPGVPAIPPEHGVLDTRDPIRFGADMLSFSPVGTATPGTFYLAGKYAQAAVRVVAGSARVRMLVCRGGQWVER
jgi:prepilin-type N-terminal cleavage/methylation domain-containing protein